MDCVVSDVMDRGESYSFADRRTLGWTPTPNTEEVLKRSGQTPRCLAADEIMTNTELINLKNALEAKRSELVAQLRGRVSELTIEDVQPELIDWIQGMSHRDVTAAMLSRCSSTLAEVQRSLRAIAQNCYGTCMECGEPIPIRRLQSIPWASYCVRCQEQVEAAEGGAVFNHEAPWAA